MMKALLGVLGMLAAWTVAYAGPDARSAVRLDIESQPLDRAITSWAEQTGYQVLIPGEHAVSGRTAPGVKGFFTPEAALKVLLASTDLTYQFANARTVAIGMADAVASSQPAGVTATRSSAAETRQSERDSGRDKIEEVVVTAQKREERLIDTPQSVSVLSSEALAKLGAAQFRDFANTVPGLSFTTVGAGYSQVSLRGVTVGSDFGPTVAMYVDDVPYTSSSPFSGSGVLALDMGLFDLDRIEVLRGPQGTLYGASTMGGLIKYVSKRPDPTRFAGQVQAGISNTQQGGVNFNVAGAVNAPLVNDKVALRASGFESRDGGYIDNVALAEDTANRSDVYGGRADLSFTPTDALTVRVGGMLQNISRDGKATVDYSLAGVPQYGTLGQFRKFAEPFDQHFRLASATVNYEFGPATLTSVSSYETIDTEYVSDFSAGYVPLLARLGRSYSAVGVLVDVSTNRFVQELRLSSSAARQLEWLVGGFYTHDDSTNNQQFLLRDPAGQPATNDLFTFSNPTRYVEYAAFGDLTWHITSKFDVSGGVRYARNDQKFAQTGSGLLGRSLPTNRSSDHAYTYLANTRYHFSDHATGYLRYATGYRPGGPNFLTINATTGQPVGQPTFAADNLKSYEAGFKSETDDGRFGFDFAGYYIDWNDIQLTVVRGGFAAVANASGGAKVRGTELTLTARPIRGFTAMGAFAYQDAELAEANPDLGGAKGERLPNVPRFTGTLNTDYELSLGTLRPSVGATLRYVSNRMASFNGSITSPQYRLPAYAIVDLRAAFAFERANIQLYVRNLADRRGQLSEATQFAIARTALIQPRTFGISTYFNF